jgi:mono/diheme cytochrome c family protein
MRNFVLGALATLVVLVGGVLLYFWLGLFPIGADNPPGRIEHTLAKMAADAYVARNQTGEKNPAQPTPANLIEGAQKYEAHCAVCHGGTAKKVSPLKTNFSPAVPQIINKIPHDDDAPLFWVTKHGIRMTGMPAWAGVLSDDEIWKVIAFVKNSGKLPPEVQTAWQQAAHQFKE